MDVVKELAGLLAEFSYLQANGVQCEAIGHHLDGQPTTWITHRFASLDQAELIRQKCLRAVRPGLFDSW